MKTFLVAITIGNISREDIDKMTAPERAIIAGWRDQGLVESAYVRADYGGAFMTMRGDSEDAIRALLSTLPMFPYMSLQLYELNAML